MGKKVTFNEFTDRLAGIKRFSNQFSDDNAKERRRMLKTIEKVAEGELTHRQKECLFMYYEKDMKMCEISNILGICISCVSRHIKKAKNKIQKIIAYYYSIK